VTNLADGDKMAARSRSPQIMADAAVEILSVPRGSKTANASSTPHCWPKPVSPTCPATAAATIPSLISSSTSYEYLVAAGNGGVIESGPDRGRVRRDAADYKMKLSHTRRRRSRSDRGIGRTARRLRRHRRRDVAAAAVFLRKGGVAFTPLNYRLSEDGLRQLIDRLPTPLVIADAEYRDVVAGAGKQVITSDEFIATARTAEPAAEFPDPDDVAVVLFTSGTTSQPKPLS